MRKNLLYLTSAIIVGLLMVLVPLVTVAGIETDNATSLPEFTMKGMNTLDKTQLVDASRIPSNEVEALAISFFVALFAYALFKRKHPRRYDKTIGSYAY